MEQFATKAQAPESQYQNNLLSWVGSLYRGEGSMDLSKVFPAITPMIEAFSTKYFELTHWV
jgi:hypothetical protein